MQLFYLPYICVYFYTIVELPETCSQREILTSFLSVGHGQFYILVKGMQPLQKDCVCKNSCALRKAIIWSPWTEFEARKFSISLSLWLITMPNRALHVEELIRNDYPLYIRKQLHIQPYVPWKGAIMF